MSAENEPRIDGEEDSDPFDLKILAIELRDEMNEAASELDKHTRNVNIARVTGGSAAVAGSIAAIIGFALIPVTAGLSAVVAGAVGAGIAAAGGVAAGGASLARVFIDKFKKDKLDKKWNEFNEKLTKKLQEISPDSYERMKDKMMGRVLENAGRVGAVTEVSAGAARAARVGVVAARASATGAKAAGGAAARAAITVTSGSIVLNLVLIGVSLYDIIDGSIQLHKQTGSQAGDYLRKLAQSLDEFARTGPTLEFLMSNSL